MKLSIDNCHIATKYNLIAPVVEQPLYNLFERELNPIFKVRRLWCYSFFSPLPAELLTGKYNLNSEPPDGSRYSANSTAKDDIVKRMYEETWVGSVAKKRFDTLAKFQVIAQELKVDMASLASAWCLKNKYTWSVIIGASRPEQIDKDITAYEILPLLTNEIMDKIDQVFANKPKPVEDFGRLQATATTIKFTKIVN